jgi:hypothetical protein
LVGRVGWPLLLPLPLHSALLQHVQAHREVVAVVVGVVVLLLVVVVVVLDISSRAQQQQHVMERVAGLGRACVA